MNLPYRRLSFACITFLATTSLLVAPDTARAENDFSVGVEGFRDVYTEHVSGMDGVPFVDTHTDYGSITAGYMHEGHGFFDAIDGRYSQGHADYKSASGAFDGIPDKEGEARVRFGMDLQMWHGKLLPYLGVGARLYYDQFKDVGPGGYDRHIDQFYIPVGVTYQGFYEGFTYAPTIEVDPLAYGRVTSDLREVDPSLPNITNTQHKGVGFRSEFMVGQKYGDIGWEVGPFMRYWYIQDSNAASIGGGEYGIEPKNTRLQYGGALRVDF